VAGFNYICSMPTNRLGTYDAVDRSFYDAIIFSGAQVDGAGLPWYEAKFQGFAKPLQPAWLEPQKLQKKIRTLNQGDIFFQVTDR